MSDSDRVKMMDYLLNENKLIIFIFTVELAVCAHVVIWTVGKERAYRPFKHDSFSWVSV